MSAPDIDAILRKVDGFHDSAFGHSVNEKDLMALADEVKRLRKALKDSRRLAMEIAKLESSPLQADYVPAKIQKLARELLAVIGPHDEP